MMRAANIFDGAVNIFDILLSVLGKGAAKCRFALFWLHSKNGNQKCKHSCLPFFSWSRKSDLN